MPKVVKTESKVVKNTPIQEKSFLDKIQEDLFKNQNYLNLVLGALIVVVAGSLLFNYFNKDNNDQDLGPSTQTNEESGKVAEDVTKDSLPGKYTVKEGDTLFAIAQNYFNDGYKYSEIVKTNKLASEDMITVGQVLDIPKLEVSEVAAASTTPAASEIAKSTPTPESTAIGGAENQTTWGEKITGDTYTVTTGDWLSTIAGRAYGDIMAFDKIAKANNITNPDVIEIGTVLKLPRN